MKRFTISILLLIFTFFSHAQSFSLVKQDMLGTNSFHNVLEVDNYLYVLNSDGRLDILDPSLVEEKQVVAQISFAPSDNENSSYNDPSQLFSFNGYVVISASNKVVYLDVSNAISPVIAFEYQTINQPHLNVSLVDNNLHYFLNGNRLFVTEYSNIGELKLVLVKDLDLDNVFYKLRKLVLDNNNLVLTQQRADENSDGTIIEFITINVSDLSNIYISANKNIRDESDRFSDTHGVYLDSKHIAIFNRNKFNVYNFSSDSVVLVSTYEADIGSRSYYLGWDANSRTLNLITWLGSYSLELDSDYKLTEFNENTRSFTVEGVMNFNGTSFYSKIGDNGQLSKIGYPSFDIIDSYYAFSKYRIGAIFHNNELLVGNRYNLAQITVDEGKFLFGTGTQNELSNITSALEFAKNTNSLFIDGLNELSVYDISSTSSQLEYKFNIVNDGSSSAQSTQVNDKYKVTHTNSSSGYRLDWYDVSEEYSMLSHNGQFRLDSIQVNGTEVTALWDYQIFDDKVLIIVSNGSGDVYKGLLTWVDGSLELVSLSLSPNVYIFPLDEESYYIYGSEAKFKKYRITDNNEIVYERELTVDKDSSAPIVMLHWNDFIVKQSSQTISFYKETDQQLELIHSFSDEFLINDGNAQLFIENDTLVSVTGHGSTYHLYQVNRAPTFNQTSLITNEDTSSTLSELVTDNEGDTLSLSITKEASSGVVSISETSLVVNYTPNDNFHGEDTFTIKASDEHGNFSEQDFTVTVTPVNDAPEIMLTSIEAIEDVTYSTQISVVDVEGDPISFSLSTMPSNGTASITETGELTYTPNINFYGSDSLTIMVKDEHGDSSSAAIAISVGGVNDAPIVNDINFDAVEDEELSAVLTATDVEGHTVNFTLVEGSVEGADVYISESGSFTFLAHQDLNGEIHFNVLATDIAGASTEQTITVNVVAVNDAPIVSPESLEVDEDQTAKLQITATDVDSDILTYSLTENPKNGSASISSTGEFSYLPALNFFGSDQVSVLVTDDKGASGQATINIVIKAVNDAPTLDSVTFEMAEDSSLSEKLVATDVEGQEVTFQLKEDTVANAIVSLSESGEFTITPDANIFGEISFTIVITDSEGASNEQQVMINVAAVQDTPIAESIAASVSHNGSSNGVMATEDEDGESLSYSLISDVSNGTLNLTTDGAYSYTPNSGFSGTDSFTYEVTDGVSSAQGIITFTVAAAPVVAKPKESSSGGGSTVWLTLLLAFIWMARYQKMLK